MVWTWSDVQYKCLMLLKLIRKSILQPSLPNVISSYHLKTIMFWVSEETDPILWKANNIKECVTRCLDYLLEYILKENCPHYFVRTNNLFKGKLLNGAKEKLVCILSRILQNFWIEVFKIPNIREVSENLEGVDIECFVDVKSATMRHLKLYKEIFYSHFNAINTFATTAMNVAFCFLETNDVDMAITKHGEYRSFTERLSLTDPENVHLWQLISHLIDISLGSQLNSKACKTKHVIEKAELIQEAESLFKRGCNLDAASGKLKLATMYFSQSKYQSALNIIDQVHVSIIEGVIQLNVFEFKRPDFCLPFFHRFISEEFHFVSSLRDNMALDVVFLPSEMNSAPDPIKFEIIRAEQAANECKKHDPRRWAAFDAEFYSLLIRFLIMHKQNAYNERRKTLLQLIEYVNKKNKFYRKISAVNIVGYCFQLVGEVQMALDVFLGSLVLLNTHNSAIWHLALLAWKVYYSSKLKNEKE